MRQAYVFTLLAVLCWTTGPVGSKAALLAGGGSKLGPLAVAFWAIASGWVALWLWVLVRRRGRLLAGIAPRGWLILALMGGTGWFGYPVAINSAYSRMPLADALIVCYAAPAFVVLFQAAPFGRVMRLISGWEDRAPGPDWRPLQVAAGLGLCLLGVAFTATGGRLVNLASLHLGVGALSALLAAVLWGVYSNLGRFVPLRKGTPRQALGDVQNAAAMTGGLLAMGAVLAVSGGLQPPGGLQTVLYLAGKPTPVSVWAVVGSMGIFNYAVGYPLWMHALELGAKAGGAHRLPTLNYLLLLLSVGVGWLVLRQGLGPGFWPGAACIAAGNVISLWPAAGKADRSRV